MKFLNDTGFVIKRINLGEADRFVTLFTKYSGKVEVLAKGVRKITSKRASSIELLNLIKFQAVKTNKNFILTEVEIVSSYEELRKKISDIQILFLVCELIDRLCPLEQKHTDIFELIEETLKRVERQEEPAVNDFQTKMLSSLGFWDGKREFKNERELNSFIEQVIERKLKTKTIFND